jgi:hypothetical protein
MNISLSKFSAILLCAALGLGPALAGTPKVIPAPNGGTGAATNLASTIGITGAHPLVMTLSGSTALTLPTSGTVISSTNFSAEIDAVFGSAQGDILYRGGSLWTVLTPGTSGFFLQTAGASANPMWAAQAGSTGCAVSGGAQFQILVNNGSSGCSSSANASVNVGALALGGSGTLGTIELGNATSGTLKLTPPTGALGTVTVTIPDLTDTLVNLTGTQSLSNKTLASPVLSGTVSGSGAIPNAVLVNPSLTVNGVNIALGGSGTITAPATSLSSATTIGGASSNQLLFVNGSNLGFENASALSIAFSQLTGLPTTLGGYGITNALSTSLTNTEIWVGNGSGNAAQVGVSGDATLANTGALIVTKSNGTAFGTAAFDNTGTSGPTIPLLNGNNTQSGNNTHTGAETFNGTIRVASRTITASGAVTVSGTADYFICVNKGTGAATAVNLPGSPATGLTYLIKDCKGDASTNNITVTPAAGNIDGSGTYVISNNYGSVSVTYNGVSWSVN